MTPVVFTTHARPQQSFTSALHIPSAVHLIVGMGAHFHQCDQEEVRHLGATWNVFLGEQAFFAMQAPLLPWVNWEPPPFDPLDPDAYWPPDPNYHWFHTPWRVSDVDVKVVVTTPRVIPGSTFQFTLYTKRPR
jgi:hypothetical protein